MDLKSRTREELESRIQKLENFIAERGIGATYLSRAKRIQRNINIAIFVGAVTTVAGLMAWAMLSGEDEEE